MALTSAQKLARAVETLARLQAEAAMIPALLQRLDAGDEPHLTVPGLPGTTYPLRTAQVRAVLLSDQTSLAADISALQAKIDQAAGVTG